MLNKNNIKLRNTIVITILIVILFSLVFLLFHVNLEKNSGDAQKLSEIKDVTLTSSNGKSTTISSEIARTYADQEKGLMYRKQMSDTEGMLFVFPTSSPQSFWMKNTYIPLDMIFFDENGNYVSVSQDAQPCVDKGDNCPLYNSDGNAKYVLEVNGGWLQKNFGNSTPTLVTKL